MTAPRYSAWASREIRRLAELAIDHPGRLDAEYGAFRAKQAAEESGDSDALIDTSTSDELAGVLQDLSAAGDAAGDGAFDRVWNRLEATGRLGASRGEGK